MLDGHFYFDGRTVAIAGEPDLLLALASFFSGLGSRITAAVAPVHSPSLAGVPAPRVVVGDLDDLQDAATGCDLIVANSHAGDIAQRLGAPLYRVGFPVYDRLGAAQRLTVGYRGTRQMIIDLANRFIDSAHHEHGQEAAGPGGTGDGYAGAKEERHAQAQAR
jgi:nitrogenase molybdenum-iron protein NifN